MGSCIWRAVESLNANFLTCISPIVYKDFRHQGIRWEVWALHGFLALLSLKSQTDSTALGSDDKSGNRKDWMSLGQQFRNLPKDPVLEIPAVATKLQSCYSLLSEQSLHFLDIFLLLFLSLLRSAKKNMPLRGKTGVTPIRIQTRLPPLLVIWHWVTTGFLGSLGASLWSRTTALPRTVARTKWLAAQGPIQALWLIKALTLLPWSYCSFKQNAIN